MWDGIDGWDPNHLRSTYTGDKMRAGVAPDMEKMKAGGSPDKDFHFKQFHLQMKPDGCGWRGSWKLSRTRWRKREPIYHHCRSTS